MIRLLSTSLHSLFCWSAADAVWRSYFDAAARLGGNEYVPTDQDILRSRIKTTGLTEERFQVGQVRSFSRPSVVQKTDDVR